MTEQEVYRKIRPLLENINDYLDIDMGIGELFSVISNVNLLSSKSVFMVDEVCITSMKDANFEDKKFVYLIGASSDVLPGSFKLPGLISFSDLKKEDISLLSIVYMDVGKELNLTPLYGESGPISDFISEGKKHIPKEFQESAISILELLIGKPYSINSANIYFTDANQVFSISGFSKPFSRILYRLK